MLNLAVLGSTGSIGTSALEVVRHHPDRLRVVALAAFGRDLDLLGRQVDEFRPEMVAVHDAGSASGLRRRTSDGVEVVCGEDAATAAATHPRVERVVAAMVGAAGLAPVHAALEAGRSVALANKEALVVAGRLLTSLARERGAVILPIDSEHVALHQALRCGAPQEVRRLVLTASGGPFRRRDPATWDAIRPEEALAHPTWSMGDKISIDSATLMNKGLEVIEASHLFSMPADRIEVVIHPRSLIHSLVEYHDGSWLAQLSINDMVLPIQYALSFPERWENDFPRLEPQALGRLEFEPLDEERFLSVALAKHALAMGESGPAVLNAANEVAVRAFLQERLAFNAIVPTVAEVLEAHRPATVGSLEEALHWDEWGRRRARERIGGAGG